MQDELRETHFAALVIGTGLSQSIVAAALSAASQPIIHVDEQSAYGGPHASLSLNELKDWAHRAEHVRIDESLVSRQYALSLAPQLVPATGPFVAALVNSGVARYGSFVMPKRVVVATPAAPTSGAPTDHHFLFRTVPSNKQDVFRDKSVSLVQKRRLIKFLVFASGEFEGSTELQGKESIPLLEFAQSTFGLERDLAEALAYAVAFCTSPNDATLPALTRTRTYLRSVGRYGPSPFLIGHYGGAGELAQGFCRTCAVGGGTYVLGRKVVSIVRAEGGEGEAGNEQTHRERTTASGSTFQTYHPPATFEGYGVGGVDPPPPQLSEEPGPALTAEPNPASTSTTSTTSTAPTGPDPASTDPGPQAPPTPQGPLFRIQLEGFASPFTANTLIGPSSSLAHILDGVPLKDTPTHTVRAIVILDAPESFAFESSEGEEKVGLDESVLVFPPKAGGESAVMGLVNGSNTMSCPDGKCILYLSAQTPSLEDSPKAYLEPYVNAVLDGCTPRPTVWAEVFWREEEEERIAVRKASSSATTQDEQAPEYSTMHFTEGADAAAREAEQVFWDVLETRPGEDGKGEGGVEFFARVGREEDLDDF